MATCNLSGTIHHVLICNGGSCMRKRGEEIARTPNLIEAPLL